MEDLTQTVAFKSIRQLSLVASLTIQRTEGDIRSRVVDSIVESVMAVSEKQELGVPELCDSVHSHIGISLEPEEILAAVERLRYQNFVTQVSEDSFKIVSARRMVVRKEISENESREKTVLGQWKDLLVAKYPDLLPSDIDSLLIDLRQYLSEVFTGMPLRQQEHSSPTQICTSSRMSWGSETSSRICLKGSKLLNASDVRSSLCSSSMPPHTRTTSALSYPVHSIIAC